MPRKDVVVPAIHVGVTPETAKWLLVGAYAVAGLMAYVAASSGASAAEALHQQPSLLRAVCLHPGVATRV